MWRHAEAIGVVSHFSQPSVPTNTSVSMEIHLCEKEMTDSREVHEDESL